MFMRNLSMLTDLYELTMMSGYLNENMDNRTAVFDMFFRSREGSQSYAIMAGVDQFMQYIDELHFDKEDLDYLASLNLFDDNFLKKLENFKFTGDIDAVAEGTIVFPKVPLVKVKAPLFEVQLIETALLNLIGHPMLIATKAHRICRQAKGDNVMEFGLRRAQGPDAGTWGARAAVIAGCASTSNVLCGQLFNIPVSGTHAHSWVMSFPDELSAFRAYANSFPENCLLLVDTYDTLHSGVPNAIKVFKELREKGFEPKGIRLDSGDLAYLSIEARKMLDDAGFPDAVICASNDLDEFLIRDLKTQGAKISLWGVGTKLITADQISSLGGVYKMSAMEDENGVLQPKMKISDNPEKITLPGEKKTYRLFGKDGMAVADYIMLQDEEINTNEPLTIFDPKETWKKTTLEAGEYSAEPLLTPLYRNGKKVYKTPTLEHIKEHRQKSESRFWPEYFRLSNPQKYKVDISQALWNLQAEFLKKRL
ncbi:MAG: nicotinate phosphoribosyltransferase [Eubacteriales bacterium]|nr:nicotinate phosphoribosyltransferase [Eubacteriales bacterium]